MSGEIVESSGAEVAVQEIRSDYIMALDPASKFLSHEGSARIPIQERFARDMETFHKEKEEELRREVTCLRARLRHPLLGPHYRIDANEIYKVRQESIELFRKEYFPEALQNAHSELCSLGSKLTTVGRKIDVFLEYLFPTPLNRHAGVREWEKTEPVKKKFSFLLVGLETHDMVTSRGREEFASMMKDKKLMPTILPDEFVQYYLGEIEKSFSDFSTSLGNVARELSTFGDTTGGENKQLEIDVKTANFALSQINKGAPEQSGLYAIMLNTALMRIGEELEPKIKRVNDQIRYIMDGGTEWASFESFLVKEGYKKQEEYLGSGSWRLTHATKKIPKGAAG